RLRLPHADRRLEERLEILPDQKLPDRWLLLSRDTVEGCQEFFRKTRAVCGQVLPPLEGRDRLACPRSGNAVRVAGVEAEVVEQGLYVTDCFALAAPVDEDLDGAPVSV